MPPISRRMKAPNVKKTAEQEIIADYAEYFFAHFSANDRIWPKKKKCVCVVYRIQGGPKSDSPLVF